MSRPTNQPKYRHYKPKNLGVVRLDGKDHYLGRYGSPESWEKYHRLVAEWSEAKRSASTPPKSRPSPLTISELIVAFWKHAQGHYPGSGGELGNLRIALRPLRNLYASTLAGDFGPLALRSVREEMVRAGVCRNQVNARINRIRRAFKWAASVELIPVAVVQALATVGGLQKGRTTARESEPVGPVAIEVVEATFPHLSRPVAGLVRLQLLTGMRPGEACAMRGRDLTAGDGTWVYKPESHKTGHLGKTREIVLGPKAVDLIKAFLVADMEAYLFDPREAVGEHHRERSTTRATKRTPSERAKLVADPGCDHRPRYSRASYLNMVVRACDRAFPHPTIRKKRGKPMSAEDKAALKAWRKAHRWHPNQLRHTVATEVRARFGLEASQVVLGHSKADVTQVYAERDLAKAREVMREVG